MQNFHARVARTENSKPRESNIAHSCVSDLAELKPMFLAAYWLVLAVLDGEVPDLSSLGEPTSCGGPRLEN